METMVQPRVRWMVMLLVVALVARFGATLALGGGFHFADEAVYVDAAQRLANGGGFSHDYNNVPAYPVFLLMLSLGLSAGPTFLRVAQAAVGAFGTLAVFALADRVFQRRIAIMAALVFALDPLVVISSGLLYPETIASIMVPLVVLAAITATEGDALGKSILCGLLLGILALLRPVGLVLPPVVAAWMLFTPWARPARRVTHVGALGLAFVLALTPWTIRNIRAHRGMVPVAMQGTRIPQEEVAQRGLVMAMARRLWTDPGTIVTRTARQFVQFWELTPTRLATDDPVKRAELHERDPRLSVQPLFSSTLRDTVSAMTFGLELVLALVGLVVAIRERPRPALLMIAIIVAYATGFALFVSKLRYRITILSLLYIFSAIGAASVYALVRARASSPEPAR
jgi:hypothetical protein